MGDEGEGEKKKKRREARRRDEKMSELGRLSHERDEQKRGWREEEKKEQTKHILQDEKCHQKGR